MDYLDIIEMSEEDARIYIEKVIWPDGPQCDKCDSKCVTKLKGKSTRPGLYQCRKCRRQFRLESIGIFRKSKIPLKRWLMAFYYLVVDRNGMSSIELAKKLRIKQDTAWHMLNRIREVLDERERAEKLEGQVEADEVYVARDTTKPTKRGRGTNLTPVLVMTERTDKIKRVPCTPKNADICTGRVVAKVIKKTSRAYVWPHLQKHVKTTATINTDEAKCYIGLGRVFSGGHKACRHHYRDKDGKRRREFVSEAGASTNTAESFNATVRHTINCTYRGVSKKHVDRYITECESRWNNRMVPDDQKLKKAIALIVGKQLTYNDLTGKT